MIKSQRVRLLSKITILAGAAMLILALSSLAQAQQRFKTPEEAVEALVKAARSGDSKSVVSILGPGSQELVSSGDPVEDANVRQEYLAAYDAGHRIVTEPGKPSVLVIGPNDWPFPIPMVQRDGQWIFDVPAGREEVLARRIGRNELSTMKDDVEAMESGDKNDFKYANDFVYPPVKVDRILRDGDTIKMGDVLLTAYHTPGHTRGATTWIANITVDGKAYVVAFPDGAGFNPGYRLVKNPSYPGIAEDYRRTHHFLETLKPDIWLAQHNEYYDFESKRQRAQTEGMKAWIDPEGFRRFIAGKKRDFEDEVDEEMGVVKKGDKK